MCCSVWRRNVHTPSTVILGALSQEEILEPADQIGRSMYGIVAIPLERADVVRADAEHNN